MSIETALQALVAPILATIPAPAIPFYWGIVPAKNAAGATITEYVSLSSVTDGVNQDDDGSDNKQFNIVSRSGMARVKAIDLALKAGLQRYKGVQSGYKISSISHVRSVELPDATTGESRIAAEYHVNYEGGI